MNKMKFLKQNILKLPNNKIAESGMIISIQDTRELCVVWVIPCISLEVWQSGKHYIQTNMFHNKTTYLKYVCLSARDPLHVEDGRSNDSNSSSHPFLLLT